VRRGTRREPVEGEWHGELGTISCSRASRGRRRGTFPVHQASGAALHQRIPWFRTLDLDRLRVISGVGVSAPMCWLSQPPHDWWWIAPIALAPWVFTQWKESWLSGAASGLALGTLQGVLEASWMAGGLEQVGAPLAHAWLGTLVVALWGAGLPWMALGALLGASRWRPAGERILLIAAGCFFVDALRSYAPGALPWGLLGHSQWNVPGVSQIAVAGGVPLVSALLGAANAAIGALLACPGEWRSAAPRAGALASAYGALALAGLPVVEATRAADSWSSSSFNVLIVQPNIPASERWVADLQRTNLGFLAEQTAQAVGNSLQRPDLVVWPETVLTSPVDADEALQRDLLEWAARLGVPIVLGAARSSWSGDPRYYRNSALWVSPADGVIASFDKTRAIPLLESVVRGPGGSALEWLFGLPASRRVVEEGAANESLRGPLSFAVALCFESIYPGLVGARRSADTIAILNLANDSWFASDVPSKQQLAFASFRAIEQRLPLIRVAHGGVSGVVDPLGRVSHTLPFNARVHAQIELRPSAPAGAIEKGLIVALPLASGLGVWWALTGLLHRKVRELQAAEYARMEETR